jgi:hypothetical protein
MQRLVTVAGKPTIRLGTKSPAGERSIALDPATVAALKAHRARQLEERLACGEAWRDHGLVFTREDGTPLRPTQLTRMFARLARGAGLPNLTLHGLRHTYATASLRAGVPVKVVSERLGHANTAITSDLYQHVLKAMDAEAANTVARLILEGEQQDSASSAVNPLSTGRPVPDAEGVKCEFAAQWWCRRTDWTTGPTRVHHPRGGVAPHANEPMSPALLCRDRLRPAANGSNVLTAMALRATPPRSAELSCSRGPGRGDSLHLGTRRQRLPRRCNSA